jgi:hypothetical protein
MSMTNSNDTIGNRTRDLPACSAVPHLTAPRLTRLEDGKKKKDICNTGNKPNSMQHHHNAERGQTLATACHGSL